ncbi:MAG: type II toxin-antitoxin system HicB family antitoxin [Thermodesulfobacteriota bacterium]
MFKVVITRGEDGYYTACCPSLRSCVSQGKTKEEAVSNIREAIELYLEPPPYAVVEDPFHEVMELSL